jgi:hypothetical protein
MDDSFSFGEPAKRWSDAKLGLDDRERQARPPLGPMLAIVGIGVALVLGLAFFRLMASGGRSGADAASTAVVQVSAALDLQAGSNLRSVSVRAMELFVEADPIQGSPFSAANAQALAAVEPSFRYVPGPSTGVDVISIAATSTAWGAAALSPTGDCAWVRIDSRGQPVFGNGALRACTGQAALGAP